MDAIYTFSIDSIASMAEDFQRVIEVPSDMPLIKLYLLVQHVISLDDAQIEAFYLASSLLGKKTWYRRLGAWVPENQAGLSLPLHHIFLPRTNRKLFYSFHFGGDRLFRISKKIASDTPQLDRKYPRVIHQDGMKLN